MVKFLDLIETYHEFSLKNEIPKYVQSVFEHPEISWSVYEIRSYIYHTEMNSTYNTEKLKNI